MPVPGEVRDRSSVEAGDIEVDAPDGPLRVHLARPRTSATRPGVIVIHEAFGLNRHIADVAERFAAAGFDALAPELFTRIGAPPEAADRETILAKLFALPDAQVVRDLDACATHLRGLEGASGRVGCVGFCMGGRMALLFAASSDRVDAVVDCWGGFVHRATPDEERTANRPVPVMDMVERVHCPVLLVGGAEDTNPSPELLRDLHARLRATGSDARLHVYEDAGHAFFADYRPNYREQQAFELWDEMVAFFRQQLG